MNTTIEVVLTQTFDRKPLATVIKLPGLDAELTPSQMRALAAALSMAAEECELQPMDRKHFRQRKRTYDIVPGKQETRGESIVSDD
jgi:hypothetical protein